MNPWSILIVGSVALAVAIYVSTLLARELINFLVHGVRPEPVELRTLVLNDDFVKLVFDSARNYTLSALLEWAGLFALWKVATELNGASSILFGMGLAFGVTLFLSGYLLVFLNVAHVLKRLVSLGATLKAAVLFALATFLVGVFMLALVVVLRLSGNGA